MVRTHVLALVSAKRSLNHLTTIRLISAPMLLNLCQVPIGMEPVISNHLSLSMVKSLPQPAISLIRHRRASKPIPIDSPYLILVRKVYRIDWVISNHFRVMAV